MAHRHRRSHHPQGLSILASVWLGMLLWVGVFWFGTLVAELIDERLGFPTFAPVWLQWLGFVLALAGVLLVLTSAYTLLVYGRGSPNPFLVPAEELVTQGPYRALRHPMYVGFIALAFGYGLLLNSLAFTVVIAPVVLVLLSLRSALEEQVLMQRHGQRYHDYRRRTLGLGLPPGRRL